MKTYKTESGRSMIEMLGVLAIIGVLSVGGIAGYSKAMMKYRINKSIEQISMIVTNVRTLFGSQKNYKALGNIGTSDATNGNGSLIAKAKLFPDELLNGTTGVVDNPNPFGGKIELIYSARNAGDEKAFMLIFDSIPEEACMDLATQNWGSASGSGLIAMAVKPTAAAPAAGGSSASAPSSAPLEGAATPQAGTALTTPLDAVYQGKCTDASGDGSLKAALSGNQKGVCGGQNSMSASDAATACDGDSNTLYLKFY